MSDNQPLTSRMQTQAGSHRRGIPADEWHVCSKIFTEGRRMRALALELRAMVKSDGSPATRHAIEQYVRALETASALGDVAAEALVTHRD